MRFTVCESTTPPVKELIQDQYIPWYCDVDISNEWGTYAYGLGSILLPLIAVIDPNEPNTYLNRSTGIQYAHNFYARLLVPNGGDVDHSGNITLADAILTLQIISNATPSVPVYVDSDINDDEHLGVEEVIYILQHNLQ